MKTCILTRWTKPYETNFEYGSGIDEYRGMDEDVDSEWRFEYEEMREMVM